MKRNHGILIMASLAGLAATPVAAQVVTLETGKGPLRIAIHEAAALPPDFPDDVPLPDGHALTRVDRSDKGITLMMDVPGEVGAVAAGLAAAMHAHGWRTAPVTAPPGGEACAWEKDARAVLAWLTAGPAGTHIQLELAPRR